MQQPNTTTIAPQRHTSLCSWAAIQRRQNRRGPTTRLCSAGFTQRVLRAGKPHLQVFLLDGGAHSLLVVGSRQAKTGAASRPWPRPHPVAHGCWGDSTTGPPWQPPQIDGHWATLQSVLLRHLRADSSPQRSRHLPSASPVADIGMSVGACFCTCKVLLGQQGPYGMSAGLRSGCRLQGARFQREGGLHKDT